MIPPNIEIAIALTASLDHLSSVAYLRAGFGGFGGTHEYICWALEEAAQQNKTTHDVVDYIKNEIIYKRMGGCSTFTMWLSLQGISSTDLYSNDGRHAQLHRRAWVQRLIAEFSKHRVLK